MNDQRACSRRYFFILAVLTGCISGCELNLSPSNPGTSTPFIITSTLPASIPPPPTWTSSPPTSTPTVIPIEGTTSTQLNVRGNPSTGSTLLGIIGAFIKVQIIGKDSSGNWYQIVYPPGTDRQGWVTAQYVVVQNKGAIPLVGAPPASSSTGTASGSTPNGVVLQQINVRSGPGTDFNSLGNLNPNDVITLTGKDPSGVWLQIQYAGGPDGKGWVTAGFVQASGAESLPIVAQSGTVLGTGTPTTIPASITPTLVPAPPDGDSAQSPAVRVVFSPSGTRSFIYSSDVSAPQGDSEDWIQFTPFGSTVSASLTCTGNGSLKVELWQNGVATQNWSGLLCGANQQLEVIPGQAYLIRLAALPNNAQLQYIHYTLRIESLP